MGVIVVYDDTGRKSDLITDIIGNKGFADVVVRKMRLEEHYRREMDMVYPGNAWKVVRSPFEYMDLVKELEALAAGPSTMVIHCFSNYFIQDGDLAALSFQKLFYIKECYCMLDDKRAVAAMFPSMGDYLDFCRTVISGEKAWDAAKKISDSFEIEGVLDLSDIGNFIQCITGSFDSRYFNSLRENSHTLVKSSANKEKIKAEYTFYHLLPDDMKFWFVMPFDYRENGDTACYSMERLHMADLAVKWVHGSMEEAEFEELMDKYFYFFACRHEKGCSDEEYRSVADALYGDKVMARISDLKEMPAFEKIDSMLAASGGETVDVLVDRYLGLRRRVEAMASYPGRLVIGHGDPCFANALYNKSTQTLKFIDPKGAMTEEELWTNPYYDVAKLSHSVCGRYDFFNNEMFDIKIGDSLSLELSIPFDNARYVEIFTRKALENGFDYLSIRVYEASLFLSMLPLHIDNPRKVLGFMLNAKDILDEVERGV